MGDIRFDNRVAIVTGAGVGLGRSHALGLAQRGAKVVINDLGVARDGSGQSSDAALSVVAEIEAMGGEAFAHGADVSDEDAVKDMVAQTMERWGRIDIAVNNAGILMDKTFAKMEMSAFRKVVDVHLIGSANVCHACWPIMREQKYGRVALTTSASGMYGNFGQSNYGAAKAAMLGLMNVLHMEGARDNIRVNTLAPTAATRMTADLLPQTAQELLAPETITPGLLYLVSEDAPSQVILGAGAGSFAQTRIYETIGITLEDGDNTPETVAARWSDITDPTDQEQIPDAFGQTKKYALNAAKARGLKLDW
ncbi:NAD(P)-dependent dehydrogenase, short-chain alcohol dehydrogenase family [Sulfitobacter brevis]|uniref:NAD(P)-dependent dehydrogenase, short-chain alcohol dehydrogenase family n=1 Tax=Sulfitobacter brevis TaxID=74348 RepID=A0A1I2AED7_9RHOB|nr:SDR family NAD(P)-dependent oxidoreductase [Sulfitobacter brevis]SFE41353.1 NAD(P)-dependent dehydrogenase, short-chain alcohol dehydrogenase family [Sulfitobacter brevis]